MRTQFSKLLLVAGLTSLPLTTTTHAEELLSDVSIESVFESATKSSDEKTSADKKTQSTSGARRITSASGLMKLLRELDQEGEELSKQLVRVDIQKGEWDLPLLITITPDEDQLGFVVLLSVLDGEQEQRDKKLLRLLAANRDLELGRFAYGPTRKRIELWHQTSNNSMTAKKLQSVMDQLADIAVDNEALWAQDNKQRAQDDKQGAQGDKEEAESDEQLKDTDEQVAAKDASVDAQSKPESASSVANLVGTWSASAPGGMGFAIRIQTSGEFELVFSDGKKTNASSGTASIENETLIMADKNGSKISAKLSDIASNRFTLQMGAQASSQIVFKRVPAQ